MLFIIDWWVEKQPQDQKEGGPGGSDLGSLPLGLQVCVYSVEPPF